MPKPFDPDDTRTEDAPPVDALFTPLERKVAETYISLLRQQTRLTMRYLREFVQRENENREDEK